MIETVQQSGQIENVATPAENGEKMFPESQVTKTVSARYNAGIERGRELAREEMQHSNPGLSEEDQRRIAREEAAKVQSEQTLQYRAKQLVDDFQSQIKPGYDKFEDFDKKVSALNIPETPEIIALLKGIPNADEVLYEMASKPHKAGSVIGLIKGKSIGLAEQAIRDLSESITKNKEAANTVNPNEPLSHLKSSQARGDDGQRSIEDLRSDPRLRG